mmetsp:Transcript_4247/g.4771  ORF Transcript_4247/g.4771 Transcript_4247/m.4771 type:complete len:264 (+) Transcript_4247:165-956(+)
MVSYYETAVTKPRSLSVTGDYSGQFEPNFRGRSVKRSVSFQGSLPENSGSRNRRLSEHGKSLLLRSYSLQELPLKPPLKPQGLAIETPKPVRESKGLRIMVDNHPKKLKSLLRIDSKKHEENQRKNPNSFSAFSESQRSPISPRAAQLSPRSNYSRQLTWANAMTIPEDQAEEEMTGWETVSAKKKNRPRVRPERVSDAIPTFNPSFFDETPDLSDIQYMEAEISDGRSWGRDKKTRQFKAVEKRNYAMQKRNSQRRSNRGSR